MFEYENTVLPNRLTVGELLFARALSEKKGHQAQTNYINRHQGDEFGVDDKSVKRLLKSELIRLETSQELLSRLSINTLKEILAPYVKVRSGANKASVVEIARTVLAVHPDLLNKVEEERAYRLTDKATEVFESFPFLFDRHFYGVPGEIAYKVWQKNPGRNIVDLAIDAHLLFQKEHPMAQQEFSVLSQLYDEKGDFQQAAQWMMRGLVSDVVVYLGIKHRITKDQKEIDDLQQSKNDPEYEAQDLRDVDELIAMRESSTHHYKKRLAMLDFADKAQEVATYLEQVNLGIRDVFDAVWEHLDDDVEIHYQTGMTKEKAREVIWDLLKAGFIPIQRFDRLDVD